jgi:hypothetical protein
MRLGVARDIHVIRPSFNIWFRILLKAPTTSTSADYIASSGHSMAIVFIDGWQLEWQS